MPPSSPSLCTICLRIFTAGSFTPFHGAIFAVSKDSQASWRARQPHHANDESFYASVTACCPICTKLKRYETLTANERSEWYLQQYDDYALFLCFAIYSSETKMSRDLSVRFIVEEVLGEAEELLEAAILTLSQHFTGHDDVIALGKKWLDHCARNHPECRTSETKKPGWYPTRLLCLAEDSIRLVSTTEEEVAEAYATMSHCWGTQPFFVLTTENIDEFRRGVDITMLPQSFQDVISVIKRLGLLYLWIDSYCIIQSGSRSARDWQSESSKMQAVYANARLNIGVTHAINPFEGCFRTRGESLQKPISVSWTPFHAGTQSTYHIFEDTGSTEYLRLFSTNHIFTRGWVYQERMLCRRMLYFTANQVYWECSGHNQMLACEEHPTGMQKPRLKQNLYPWALETTSSKLRQGEQSPLELWGDVVSQYTELNLTYPHKDKFLALGGIAQRMAHAISDQYVAGMFRSNLIAQLTWRTRFKRSHRSPGWRAPTWSWASIDGHIEPGKGLYEALATVEEISITLLDPSNAYGALKTAALTLRCRPLHATYLGVFKEDVLPEMPYLRIFRDHDFSIDDVAELPVPGSEIVVIVVQVWSRSRARGERSRSTLVQDISASIEKLGLGGTYTLYGLLLHQSEAGIYKRLGCIIMRDQWKVDLLEMWQASSEQNITIV